MSWQNGLSLDIDDDTWESIVGNTLHMISNKGKNTRETQFKILHKMHWNPLFRSKFYPKISPACPKCNTETGTSIHLFWTCPTIMHFWDNVKEEISKILGHPTGLTPLHCLLAANFEDITEPHRVRLFDILLYAARKSILQLWISNSAPSLSLWYQTILKLLPLERLTSELHSKLDYFLRILQPFLEYLDPALSNILNLGMDLPC